MVLICRDTAVRTVSLSAWRKRCRTLKAVDRIIFCLIEGHIQHAAHVEFSPRIELQRYFISSLGDFNTGDIHSCRGEQFGIAAVTGTRH